VVVPIPRLRHALGAVLLVAVLVLPGGPAGAAPPAGTTCPDSRAHLAGQRITAAVKLPDLTCADLHGTIFDGLDLVQAGLDGADARGASFRHTRLIQAHFTGADLRGAHFEHADLGQAKLDRVDARGAFFGHADLGQADLDSADLRGADFIHASMIQADLSDTDLRGAKTYWTESGEADVSDARVDLTDPRTFQLSLLAPAVGLVLLVMSVVAVARGRGTGGGPRKGLVRLSAFVGAAAFVWLLGGTLFPLLFIVTVYPLLAGAVLVFLSGLVRGYTRTRTPPAAALVDTVEPTVSR
jgi:predicted small integral membrane protein